MNKVCVTIRERVCSGVERDWQFAFDSEQEAKVATKDLPYNCWIVYGPSPVVKEGIGVSRWCGSGSKI